MKKNKLITIAMIFIAALLNYNTFAQQQVINGDFEQWEIVSGSEQEPVQWSSFRTCDGALKTSAAAKKVTNSIHKRPYSQGSQSAVIWSNSVLGVVANGNLTTGQIQANSISAANVTNNNTTKRSLLAHNMPFTGKPDSLTVWVKYVPKTVSNQARISAIIHGDADYRDPNNNNDGIEDYVVGKAALDYSATSTKDWQRLKIPFDYNFAHKDPRYILISITTNKTPGGGSSGDSLYVDDMLMIYTPTLTLNTVSSTEKVALYESLRTTKTASIAYTLEGTMSPYNLNKAKNEVIAYLSDINGNFADSTEIGRVTSDISGNLTITIPNGVSFGVNSKIRLWSTNYPMQSKNDIEFYVPIALPASNITSNSVTAHWTDLVTTYGTAPAGFIGYQIAVYDVTGNEVSILTAAPSATSITIPNLSEATYYSYKVRRVSQDAPLFSNAIECITAGSQIMTWNQELETINVNNTTPIPLTATVSSNLPIVYTSSDESVVRVVNGNTLVAAGVGTATITAAQAGTADIASISAAKQITIIPATPVAIESKAANGNNDTNSKANWNAANGAATYTVKLYSAAGELLETAEGISGTSYAFTSLLTEGTPYYFTVTAVNGELQSETVTHSFTTRKNQVITCADVVAVMKTSSGNGNVNFVTINGTANKSITINSVSALDGTATGLTSFTPTKLTSNTGTTAVAAGTINVSANFVGTETILITQLGNDVWMPATTTIIATIRPTNPSGTASTTLNTTGTSFTISGWSQTTGVDGYAIYQSKNDGDFDFVATITPYNATRTYPFNNLAPDTKYVTRIYTIKNDIVSNTYLTNTTTTPKQYTITYNGVNPSEVAGFAEKFTAVTPTIALQNPADRAEDTTFVGWFTNSDFENATQITQIELGTAQNIELYAQWSKPQSFAINYHNAEGVTHGNPTEYQVYSEVTLSDPSREGYTFDGWYSEEECQTAFTGINKHTYGTVNVWAKWNEITYTVTYHNIERAEHANADTYTVVTPITLQNPTTDRTGYTFGGWYAESTFASKIETLTIGNTDVWAKWNPITYTITFDVNGANLPIPNKKTFDVTTETFTLLSPGERDGYTFGGWYTTSGDTFVKHYSTITKGSVTENLVLRAAWNPKTYHITYKDLNGTTHSNQSTYYTTEVVSLTKPTTAPAGYEFAGWHNGVEIITKIQDVIDDITLTAKWKPIEYSITYTNLEGTTTTNTTKYTIESETFAVTPPSSRTGYHFIAWYLNGLGITQIEKGSITGDLTLSAKWDPITYYITYNANAENMSNPATQTYNIEMPTFNVPTLYRTGYVFDGWFNSANEKIEQIAQGSTGDTTLTAKWNPIKYTITYNANGGTVNPAKTEYSIETVNNLTLPTPTRDAYTFAGWYDGTTKIETIQLSTGNITLTAQWDPITYTITYHDTFEVTNPNPSNFTIETPSFTLQNISREGYTFDGWKYNGIKNNRILKGSWGDLHVYALWIINNYTITYHLGNGVNASENKDSYTVESIFALQNPSRAGYNFEAWFTDADFTNAFTGLTNGNVDVYAKWNPIEYTITFDTKTTEVVNSIKYTIESNDIAVPTLSRNGYSFDGWFNAANTKVEKIAKASTGDTTLTAKWQIIDYNVTYNSNVVALPNPPEQPFTVETETFAVASISRDGYEFLGWFDGNTKVTEIAQGTYRNIALLAQWETIPYYITYHNVENADNYHNVPSYTIESEVTLNAATKNGYDFMGWFSDAAFTHPIASIALGSTGNTDVYAQWKLHTYTITYVNSHEEVNNPNQTEYDITSPTISLQNLEDLVDADFLGWFTSMDFNNQITEIPAASYSDITLYAKWSDITVFSITYNYTYNTANGNPNQYTKGYPYTFLPLSGRIGYDFTAWKDSNGDTVVTRIETTTVGELHLDAQWTPTQYSISYKNIENADNSANSLSSYTIEDKVTLQDIERKGYNFLGWTNENGETITEIPQGTIGDKTITAQWAAIPYSISYPNTNLSETDYTIETETFSLPIPTRVGYDFTGWVDAENNAISKVEKGSIGNFSVFAQWTPTVYDVEYNNVKEEEHSNPATYTIGTAFAFQAPNNRAGYSFTGWYSDAAFTQSIEEIPTGSTGTVVVFAQWRTIPYNITYANSELADGTYTIENEIVLQADPARSGYEFTGWVNETGETITNIEKGSTGNVVVTAQWIATQYSIEYRNTEGVSHTNPKNYTIESEITLQPLVRSGYYFNGWFTDAALTKPISTIAKGSTEKIVLYAQWTAIYIPTYAVTIHSRADDAEGEGDYQEGDEVTIFAGTAPEGFKFAQWTVETENVELDDATQASTNFTMPAEDVTLTAVFEPISIVINESFTGRYNGTLDIDVFVPDETNVSIPYQSVILTQNLQDGTYSFSILNFVFPMGEGLEIPLGNLEVSGIAAEIDEDNNVILTKGGVSAGPAIEMLGGLGTLIHLNEASVINGELYLDLSVDLDVEGAEELGTVANVFFNGTRDANAFTITINSPAANATGQGVYAQGDAVSVFAGTAPQGMKFVSWRVDAGSIKTTELTQETISFTMPAENVSLTAVFEPTNSITGRYNGLMEVEVIEPTPDNVEMPDQNVIVSQNSDGTYSISILDFVFMNAISLGNLEVSGITAQVDDNNKVLFSKSGVSAGPVIEDLGNLGTLIHFNEAYILNGELYLNLSVDLDGGEEMGVVPVANVIFNGKRAITEELTYAVSIISPAADATASRSYGAGVPVTIFAGTAPAGQQFSHWTIEPSTVVLASATSATTTFTMPAEAVTLTANFETITDFTPQSTPTLVVYPNPVITTLHIGGVSVEKALIYSVTGVKVAETNANEINVAQLANGTYTVVVKTKEGRTLKQAFIKQ
ncbi:MAG: InlB B-repeat-containing protein [Bacteroidales bacterium]|jgi:uncharacterized repeat protein (TIGR02543 family)|nr:InlB B-repeat-containing protein [Bacteroidales bacterium]